ncbi:uncharacterized protein LOC126966763 isoform X2 [Leptidea sinapis]|uniref:uncharacterized protein LOC126966763 isoform X2 n=1 Tax=Leptidea sinapis TaxID=189913 RepID=UPI0021C32B12|nr:uncharacterized protein LOC126966763 isoform X2 [Leptidea sinapis]
MLHLLGPLQSQVILGQALSTQHLLPTIIQQDFSEPYVSNFILEKASTSTTFQPVAADLTAPQRTKIKHLQAEISRLRKKGQSFKARLKGGADRSIVFCQEN